MRTELFGALPRFELGGRKRCGGDIEMVKETEIVKETEMVRKTRETEVSERRWR